MKCKKCGCELNSDDQFCPNCGSKVEQTIKCIVCGADIEPDSVFCQECGSSQKDFIKCPTCGEVNKKEDKFCFKCGNDLSKKNINNSKKEFKKAKPVLPQEEPIVKKTPEVTREEPVFYEDTNKKSKAPVIIIVCLAVLLVLGGTGFALYHFGVFDKLFNKSSDIDQQVISEDQNQEITIGGEDSTIIENITVSYTYYKLEFIENVRVRDFPSKDADQVGKIAKGSLLVGFSETYSEGYTWYQIGHDEWVANDGSFLKVKEFDLEDEYKINSGSYQRVNVTKDTSIYDGPGYSNNTVGWLTKTSKFKVFESVKDDQGNTWLKISPCEYVPNNCVEYIK